ncbi:MAG: hypothetical protein [Circular genetic element sp.]|nr:MAG: hypothetical protein [Circular genetic element sp.]
MPRKSAPKNKKKKVIKRSGRGLTMNQMLSKMCITKIHTYAGITNTRPFGASANGLVDTPWYLHFPLNLARNNAMSAGSDTTARESSRIHFKNVKYDLQFLCNPKTIRPVQYRVFFGYFKGDDNLGTQGLTASVMGSAFPTVDDNLKRSSPSSAPNVPSASDFYMKYVSKVFTLTPKQIYDSNGSDDYDNVITPGVNEPEPMRALWLPKSHKFNFQLNRTFSYEGADGDTLNGYLPVFGVQATQIGDTWTRPDIISNQTESSWGQKPCPLLKVNAVSYFCDIN